MNKLSDKQQRFADEYIISLNATEAYKKAGYKVKSDNVAKTAASRLLTNVNVQKYLSKKMESLQKDTIATQEEVLEHLTRVLRREEQEHQVVTLRIKEEKWVVVDDKGTLKKQTVESEKAEVIPMPTRVSDTNKAAELLGKRYVLWTDKQEVTGSVTVNKLDSIIQQLTDEDD